MATTPFPYDPVQTSIATAYRNPKYIADQVLPRKHVGAEKFKWHSYPVEETFRLPDTTAGRRGRLNEIQLTLDEHYSSTTDYGLSGSVPQPDQDQAGLIPNFDPVGNLTMQIAEYVELDREVRVAALVFDAAQYPTANKVQLSGNDQWSAAHADSNPIADILAGSDAMLMPATHLVLGYSVWQKIRTHPVLVQAILGVNSTIGIITRRQLAELFELEEVLVGQPRVNTAKFGQAATLTRVWGNHALLCHVNPIATPAGELPTFGITAQYQTRLAGAEAIAPGKMGLRGGTRVWCGESVRELLVASQAAYFIQDAVS